MLCDQEGYANRADHTGALASARAGGLLPAFDGDTHILNVGVRWDIGPHWMLRAEYGRHRGTFELSTRENPIPGDREEYWDLFAVQAVFASENRKCRPGIFGLGFFGLADRQFHIWVVAGMRGGCASLIHPTNWPLLSLSLS